MPNPIVGSAMRQFVYAVSVNPDQISGASTGETTVTVPKSVPGQVIIVQPPSSLDAGIICAATAVCTTAGQVILRLANVTANPINVAASTFVFVGL